MAELNHKQVDVIYDLVLDHGVSYRELQMDIVDHLCCMVEQKMDSGSDFRESLTLSTKEFGIQTLPEIQEATLYLLTLKLRKMKKATGILGIISSALIMGGVVFKINHFPGAGVMLVLGLALISVVVLPLFAFIEINKQSSQLQKITSFSGIISGALISVGTMFKIMHWPTANIIITTGIILMALVFIPLFTVKSYKTAEFKLLAIAKSMMILSGIIIIWGIVPLSEERSPIEKTHHSYHQNHETD
jgi:hypothetical protein